MKSEHLCVLPEGLSIQQILWAHYLRNFQRLRELSSISNSGPPLNQQTECSQELVDRSNAVLKGFELLNSRLRRIEGYLGYERPESDAPSTLEAAKVIRSNIQRGDSDEAIALFLEKWQRPRGKRGRPKGTNDTESVAVLALQLHERDPRQWTWPKIADQLLNCKLHAAHDGDSSCTVSLKQAVHRLRAFLKELQSD